MKSITKNLIIGAVAGLAASWIKSKVESPLQEVGERIFPPTEHERHMLGADQNRNPENMPSAVLIDNIYETSTGYILPYEDQQKAVYALNMATGMTIGALYSVAVTPIKVFQIGNGMLAGAVIWGLTHGSTLPSLGLQDDVEDMPKSWFIWKLGSHMIYGIVLEQGRRLLSSIFTKKK